MAPQADLIVIPFYNEKEELINDYALVFFDGPHDNSALQLETNFFVPRSKIGTVFVYDDIWMYDHDELESYLFTNGFKVLEKKNIKASYIKSS